LAAPEGKDQSASGTESGAALHGAEGTAAPGSASGIAYRRLAAELRDQLARGEFAHGRQLPTEAQLSEAHQVSRQTVRRALQDLVAEGLVYRVRGRGTFATAVSPGSRHVRSFGSVEDLLAYSVETTLETIEPLSRRIDVEAASRLRLPTDEVMTALLRRHHDGAPFCAVRLYLPVPLGTAVVALGMLAEAGQVTSQTVISVIDRVSAMPITGAHQSITASTLEPRIAELIDGQAGEPALRIDRLDYNANGEPVELSISYFNPARYSYRVELTRSS
jgi:GntR family transcriptional regulator